MYYAGCLLLATTELTDSIFERSVILICEHNADGAMGLILNKESPIPVKELSSIFPIMKTQSMNFLKGGPVALEEVWILHNLRVHSLEQKMITEDLFLTMNTDFLKSVTEFQLENRFIQFFLGYAGWSSGQLELEIERGSWVTSPYSHDLVWASSISQRWNRAMYRLGEDYACLAYSPKNAWVN